jgi:hypothetical protein
LRSSDVPLTRRQRVETRLDAPVAAHLFDDLGRLLVLALTNRRLG